MFVCATKKRHRGSQIYSKNNSIRDIFCYITKLILRKIILHQISAWRFFAGSLLCSCFPDGSRLCPENAVSPAGVGWCWRSRQLWGACSSTKQTARLLADCLTPTSPVDTLTPLRRRFVSLFHANF